MVIFYKKWKKDNEFQLTKNKMDLNIRKMTNHPPSPGIYIRYITITSNTIAARVYAFRSNVGDARLWCVLVKRRCLLRPQYTMPDRARRYACSSVLASQRTCSLIGCCQKFSTPVLNKHFVEKFMHLQPSCL